MCLAAIACAQQDQLALKIRSLLWLGSAEILFVGMLEA